MIQEINELKIKILWMKLKKQTKTRGETYENTTKRCKTF